jgi:hypothetical protein
MSKRLCRSLLMIGVVSLEKRGQTDEFVDAAELHGQHARGRVRFVP